MDYNDVRPQFKAVEAEQDEKELSAAENRQALLHPERIREITQYILSRFRQKTHRLNAGSASTPCLPSAAWMHEVLLRSVQNTTGRQPAPVENSHHFSLPPTKSKTPSAKLLTRP